jgi:hypothetical protein
MADRILAGFEELLHKFLVHDGNGRRSKQILRLESPAHQNMGADGIKVFRITLNERRTAVGIGLALNLNAGAPVVVFHWRVGGDADFHNAR